MMYLYAFVFVVLLGRGLSTISVQAPHGLDPIDNYCQRFDHQSTIKNGKLYIDGGTQTFVPSNNHGNYKEGHVIVGTNNYLIEIDMTESWDWTIPTINETLISKTAGENSGANPPQVVRGGLFSGSSEDHKIYLYGGTTSYRNTDFPGFQPASSDQYTLWSYDTQIREWEKYDVSKETPQRVNSGAAVEAPDQGLAFYFNGQIDNGSSTDTSSLGMLQKFVGGMAVIDTKLQTIRNVSTGITPGSNPISRAKVAYVPELGGKGILVIIGGSSRNVLENNGSDIGTMAPMDKVTVFDIASIDNGGAGRWYEQQTSGDSPSGRVDHCVVASSAPDNSSHQIIVYGGRSSDTDLIDDLWSLSIPAFRWTKLAEGNSPRYGMTCHIVGAGNRQMLTVGGSNTPYYDNLDSGCDWESKGVAILDIASVNWGSAYNASAEPYTVPPQVVADIGGEVSGGATFTRPKGDFVNAGLAELFDTTFNNSSSNGTSTKTSHKSANTPAIGTGAIAGIVVGFLVCIVLVGGGVWVRFFHNFHTESQTPGQDPPAEIGGYEIQEKFGHVVSSVTFGPWQSPVELPTAGKWDSKPLPPEPARPKPLKTTKVAEIGSHALPPRTSSIGCP